MSEGRHNSPSWMPQLISALATVGAVWAMIRTEVPSTVRQEVRAVMAEERVYMAIQMDSAWSAAQDSLHKRVAIEAGAVRDSLQRTLDLVRTSPAGTVTYSPHITVQADTAGTAVLIARMDTVEHLLRRRTNEPTTLVKPSRPGSKKGSDGWKR